MLHAQTAPQDVVINTHPYFPPSQILRVDTSLVETSLAVWDSAGHPVPGLHASDFEVLDKGVSRPIVAFSELHDGGAPATPAGTNPATSQTAVQADIPPPQPKYVVFFFDDFHVDNGSMLFVKQGARAYIAKGLTPGDHLAIVTASGQGDLDFTTDAKRFAERLEHVAAHIRPVPILRCGVSPMDSYIFLHNMDGEIVSRATAAAEPCVDCADRDTPAKCQSLARGVALSAAQTTWEQVLAQSINTMDALGYAAKKLSVVKGARILALTSQGFMLDPGIPPNVQAFIDGALRWNITVHAIAAQGLDATLMGRKDMLYRSVLSNPLESMTNGTGGHYFQNNNDLAGEMRAASNPAVTYLVGFQAGAPDGKFHPLKVRFTTKRDGSLQFRPGYFSPNPKLKPSARARMDDAVFTKEAFNEVAATAVVSTPEAGKVSILIKVDIDKLPFSKDGDRHAQQLVFLASLLDSNGGFVAGKESMMELDLTDERLVSMKKSGLGGAISLAAPPGSYQVRTIVREAVKGALFASTTPVELRSK